MYAEMQHVYTKYVKTDADYQVNLPSTIVSDIENKFSKTSPEALRVEYDKAMAPGNDDDADVMHDDMDDGDEVGEGEDATMLDGGDGRGGAVAVATIFDKAQDEIFNLMERDSCPRYFRSTLYLQMKEAVRMSVHKAQVMQDMQIL